MKPIIGLFVAPLLLFMLLAEYRSVCQDQTPPTSVSVNTELPAASEHQARVFVFVQRTKGHVKHSSAEVFHQVVDDIMDYLKAKNVAIAVDEFGGRNHAESATPMDTVFNIARDAGGSSVLYIEVDRPVTKWIKLTAQCFDMQHKLLWKEEASSGGGLTGGHGLQVSTKKFHGQLDKRVGQNGLPVLLSATPVAEKQ